MFYLFARYASIGVINTAIHWCVFFFLTYLDYTQTVANINAFMVAVTFSFFANAKFTFKGKATTGRYLLYIAFMAIMAASIGYMGDVLQLRSVITLIVFSAVSLITGFIYSKYIVFREKKNNENNSGSSGIQ